MASALLGYSHGHKRSLKCSEAVVLRYQVFMARFLSAFAIIQTYSYIKQEVPAENAISMILTSS